uniref:Uncharacterized protein n=1 Tax=Chenopodium quinoa TaxID=63459 RepID=A0A803MBC1_CHEQI
MLNQILKISFLLISREAFFFFLFFNVIYKFESFLFGIAKIVLLSGS